MNVSNINNQYELQSLLINDFSGKNRFNNNNNAINQTADYAKKGEPMYIADMDTDSDGTVSLDEFRDYCKSKNINVREMMNMSQMASAYRTMKAENDTIDYISKLIPNVFPKLKQSSSESSNLKQEENKFNISSDENKKVNYEEYMDYCEHNVVSDKLNSYTTTEKNNDGNLKITNYGKAVNSYKNSGTSTLKSTFEESV